MASVAPKSAPATYGQSSRKSKKAWRKNVDLTKVEAGLSTVRDELIQGGVIAEKPSSELFAIDTSGSIEIRKQVAKVFKPLKADQILAQRSAIPAVDTHTRPRGVTDGVIEPASKKRRNDVSREQYDRLRQRAYGGEAGAPKEIVETENVAGHDPWEVKETVSKTEEEYPFLEKPKPVRAPETLSRAPVSLLEGSKIVPAIIKPAAALSYNPVFEDWEEKLEREGAQEVQAEMKRLEKARAEREQQELIERAQAAEDEALRTEDESVWEGFESEKSEGVHLVTKLPKRKTPAERNKVKRRKQREQEARYQEGMKKSGQRVSARKGQGSDPSQKEAAVAETETNQAEQSSDDEIDDRVLRRRKLGKHRLPEKDLELVLPDELQDSLRLLKPEGNLLKDRFRSMMVRGKVETRKPLPQQKKAKRFDTEKWSYKDWTLPGIQV